jgi:GT2 family glycosyltransferase
MTASVTWMIPVLNGMPYLSATLASIQSQTFQDFQVVIWDNGSTDGTLGILSEWIPAKLPGRVVTGRPMPLGLSRAAMIAESDSELCALIDADDINDPTRLEKQFEFLKQHPDVAVVGTQLNQLSPDGVNLGPLTEYPLAHAEIVQELLVSNPIGQPSVLLRRSHVLEAGNYRDFSPTHVEDYDLWLRMAGKGFRLANLPESLVNYRVHEQSTTRMSIKARRLEGEMDRRLSEAAPALFGVDGQTMLQLRQRVHPHAIHALRQIAEHIGGEENPWRSQIFYKAARSMIADRDLRSRIGAALENRGSRGALSEAKSIGKTALRSLTRRIGLVPK